MASVIDAFLVSFGLDAKGYKKGADEIKKADAAIRGTVEETNRVEGEVEEDREKRQKKSLDTYKKIRTEVLGLFAVFTAGRGIKNFIGDTVDQAANLGFLAENLKLSTTELTAWQRASERMGGSAEGINAQLKESADTLAQLASGMGPTGGLQWFFRMGGSSDDLKSGNTYLLARSKIVHDMFQQDPAKAALIARNLGISEDQFDFIKQGPAAIMALVEAQRKNSVITEKDAGEALKLRNAYLDLTQSLQATAVKLLVALLPAFTRFIGVVEGFTKYLTDNKDVVAGWADKIVNFDWSSVTRDAKDFASNIKSITDNIKELLEYWNKWTTGGKIPATAGEVSDVIGRNVYTPEKTKEDIKERKETGETGAHGETVPTLMSTVKEFYARTLASFGSKDAGRYIRDTTGRDDYNVGVDAQPKPDVKSATGARGIRNNNPGNIEYGDFARRYGATGADSGGRFARFNSGQEGINAMAALLKSYGDKGINSINAIVERYAPGHENNTKAYKASISRDTGIDAGAKLNLNDPRVLQPLLSAMIKHENGSNPYSDDMIRRATAANPAAVGAQAQAVTNVARQSTNAPARAGTTTVTNNIDKIEINTKATDASGIARDIRPELGKLSFPNQASSGVRQ